MNRSLNDGNAEEVKMSDNFDNGCRGDEAQVCRTGGRMQSVWRDRGGGRMQINLLVAETESTASFCESDELHVKNTGVKYTSRFDIADCKNKVVKAINGHGE
jgi:hypothetical protein